MRWVLRKLFGRRRVVVIFAPGFRAEYQTTVADEIERFANGEISALRLQQGVTFEVW